MHMPEKKSARSTAPKEKAAAPTARKSTASKRRARTGSAKSAAAMVDREDLHARVQRRAYELWESEGRPAGREHDHWLRAEREIAGAHGV